jgi:hypothetical protein
LIGNIQVKWNNVNVFYNDHRTILVEDNGIIYVTGISLGNCDAKFEIPYINIFELIGWIEMQINPGKRKPKQLDFCNTENPGVIEETCPIIIESYSGVPTCEGRDRFVRGQVRLDNFNKCNIFCPVFPHNTITITLDEAQSLCWQQKEEMEQKKEMEKAKTAYLEETEFVNSKESVKVGAWDQLDSTAVVVEPSKNDFMQKYGKCKNINSCLTSQLDIIRYVYVQCFQNSLCFVFYIY